MTKGLKERIARLQDELRAFMDHAGGEKESSRLAGQVEDLVGALYFRLEQLKSVTGRPRKRDFGPRERLADALRKALAGLAAAPEGAEIVTDEIASDFEAVLDLFDLSSMARIRGETEAIKLKRRR